MQNQNEKELMGWAGPEINKAAEGRTVITTVVSRPRIDRIKSTEEKKGQIEAQRETGGLLPPSYKRDSYDYEKVIPEFLPVDALESLNGPDLKIAVIRHTKHKDNVVGEEAKEELEPRVENMIDDLGIDESTEVYVLSSPSGVFVAGETGEEVKKISRTETTAEVVKSVLKKKGIKIRESIDDSTDSLVRSSFSEFPVTDAFVAKQADEKIAQNIKAKKGGTEKPFPDMPDVDPTVYASNTNLADLEAKTGMAEVSSATVVRGLGGFDAIEHYFLDLQNKGEDKKIVVIVAGHGQFITDMSEALLIASEFKHPVAIAGHGAYWFVEAKKGDDGKILEKYSIEASDRTGMFLPKKIK